MFQIYLNICTVRVIYGLGRLSPHNPDNAGDKYSMLRVIAYSSLVFLLVTCSTLSIDHGSVTSVTTVGSVATYTCDSGYVLLGGSQQRTCQDNGTWDGTEPSCICK